MIRRTICRTLTSAWIETVQTTFGDNARRRRTRTSAWIETGGMVTMGRFASVALSRVRGLKQILPLPVT